MALAMCFIPTDPIPHWDAMKDCSRQVHKSNRGLGEKSLDEEDDEDDEEEEEEEEDEDDGCCVLLLLFLLLLILSVDNAFVLFADNEFVFALESTLPPPPPGIPVSKSPPPLFAFEMEFKSASI